MLKYGICMQLIIFKTLFNINDITYNTLNNYIIFMLMELSSL